MREDGVATRPQAERVAVLGFALPQDRFDAALATDAGERMAIQRFGTSLLAALLAAGVQPLMLSAVPATDFPHNRRIGFGLHRYVDGGVPFVELPFVNITVVKHVTRALSALTVGWWALARHRADALVVQGLPSAFLAVAVVIGRVRRMPTCVLITDPPDVPHAFDNRVSLVLKRVDGAIIRRLVRAFDGVVALTAAAASDLAPGLPALVMEGILPPAAAEGTDAEHTVEPPPAPRPAGPPRALYAGGLKEEYGVGLLLEAREVSGRAFELDLYGKGPMEGALRAAAAADDGIRFHGAVDWHRLQSAYREADVLVNPRPTEQSFVPYSFPSKVLEYLATPTPVVSTRLSGIPEEYFEHVVGCAATPEAIAEAVLAAATAGAAGTGDPARRRFVAERTAPAQGRRLAAFLGSLVP